jgi:hypothetical protein
MSVAKPTINPSDLGIALFGITVDDHNHAEVIRQLGTFPSPLLVGNLLKSFYNQPLYFRHQTGSG